MFKLNERVRTKDGEVGTIIALPTLHPTYTVEVDSAVDRHDDKIREIGPEELTSLGWFVS